MPQPAAPARGARSGNPFPVADEKRYIKTGSLPIMTTTLWDYVSRTHGSGGQGDDAYVGATPSYVIANLLERYTRPKQLVVDPMCGSGTTLDVARDMGRRALGYDVQPTRPDIFRADARTLPLEDGKADFVFVDPPYSTHVRYSGLPECIGELDARGPEYFPAMEKVIAEIDRILRPDRYMGLYVSDTFEKGKPFVPIGFELFALLRRHFTPVDVVAVARHNRTLKRNHWHTSALEGNYFLRGFNYLFIMYKEAGRLQRPPQKTPEPEKPERKARPAGGRPPARKRHGAGRDDDRLETRGEARRKTPHKRRDDSEGGPKRPGKGKPGPGGSGRKRR